MSNILRSLIGNPLSLPVPLQHAALDQRLEMRRGALAVHVQLAAVVRQVPSSMTMTNSPATCWPTLPANNEVSLQMKSAAGIRNQESGIRNQESGIRNQFNL